MPYVSNEHYGIQFFEEHCGGRALPSGQHDGEAGKTITGSTLGNSGCFDLHFDGTAEGTGGSGDPSS